MRHATFAAVLALALAAAAPVLAQVSASELARSVDIPFEEFILDNGLRDVAHTDRKAPVVAVAAPRVFDRVQPPLQPSPFRLTASVASCPRTHDAAFRVFQSDAAL